MLRFYPDTNVVHLLAQTWSPEDFDRIARRRELMLALGFHVVYELARGFRALHHRANVAAACRFLSEIDRVEFQPTVHDIVRTEFYRATTGLELVTVLTPANRLLTRQELATMAMGRTTPSALPFIEAREARSALNRPRLAGLNMESIRAALADNPLARRLCRTFDGFKEYMTLTAPPMLRRLAIGQRVRVTDAAIRLIVGAPERFPVLSTWLNAQWYLMWVSGIDRRTPARDSLDDFRHLTESARCDLFVTRDGRLVRRAPHISPFRKTEPWAAFRARLS